MRRMLEQGRCRVCGAPRSRGSKFFCEAHRQKKNEQNRRYRERVKRKGGEATRPGPRNPNEL